MKKRRLLLLTIGAMLLSLVSCSHTCEPTRKWSSDPDTHWHACQDENCNIQSDKTAHSWNEGELTKKPTPTEKGERLFLCTVCDCVKTESVEFHAPTEAEWNQMFDESRFVNVTYRLEITICSDISREIQTYIMQINGKQVLYTAIAGNPTSGWSRTESKSRSDFGNILEPYKVLLNYDDYDLDAERNVYRLNREIKINCLAIPSSTSNATITVEDGKLAKFKYTCIVNDAGVTKAVRTALYFTDYGTTNTDTPTFE